MTNCPTGNDCLGFPDGDVQPPEEVDVSEIDESTDEPTSGILTFGTKPPLLSHRQCQLTYQQLCRCDVCLEESFPALMDGSSPNVRVCVLEVCGA